MTRQASGRPADQALDVLIVVDSVRDNGGLRVAMEYGRLWNEAGTQAVVAAVQDVHDAPLLRPHPSIDLRFLGRPDGRLRHILPTALGRLVGMARRSDVMLAGAEQGVGLLLTYAAARIARKPFAVLVQAELDRSIDTWVPGPLRRITRFVHARCDAAISVAHSIVPGILANGLPAERVSVVLNGIDVAAVRSRAGLAPHTATAPASSCRRRGDGIPTVIGIGRLSAEKDFSLLVRAHAKVRAGGVDHRVVIIGEGPARTEITGLMDELGVTDSVQLLGHTDNPFPRLAAADLFVLSSRTEGTPLTVLEALAVGAPIVATRCSSGVEDLLGDEQYGDLVPPGSVDALASAMEKNLRDPSSLAARAADGPARALTFDVARSAQATLGILTELATGARAGGSA